MRQVEIYWSFRSPYSYLATPRLKALSEKWDIPFVMRPVLPIAVRIPGFFKKVNPLWPPYVGRDCKRLADFMGLPFGPPNPDPIVMDMGSGEVPEHQPYIHRLTRLGVLASREENAIAFFDEVSRLIWGGQVKWDEGDHLEEAVDRAGFNLASMDAQAEANANALDEEIENNSIAQTEAGHWGVPMMVFENEPFFGQDRLELLEWRLERAGVSQRG